ncbi:MAG: hypothetical protein IH852_08735 [Bacteroidetes bacterium]|nr:hypothetical protein [Bacteroidota bacterium]
MFTVENKRVLLLILSTILFSINYTDVSDGGDDEKIKKFPEEMHLTKNYRELKKFFKDNSIIIPKKFPLNFAEQLTII